MSCIVSPVCLRCNENTQREEGSFTVDMLVFLKILKGLFFQGEHMEKPAQHQLHCLPRANVPCVLNEVVLAMTREAGLAPSGYSGSALLTLMPFRAEYMVNIVFATFLVE